MMVWLEISARRAGCGSVWRDGGAGAHGCLTSHNSVRHYDPDPRYKTTKQPPPPKILLGVILTQCSLECSDALGSERPNKQRFSECQLATCHR